MKKAVLGLLMIASLGCTQVLAADTVKQLRVGVEGALIDVGAVGQLPGIGVEELLHALYAYGGQVRVGRNRFRFNDPKLERAQN